MVTVVVPVYNVEKYLPACIESILAQTYQEFELILVDDGSTDNSLSICKEYEQKDTRIKVIHQANKGLSGARNTGVLNSKGEYIFFVDSDDCIDESLLEATVKIAEKTKAGIVQINLKSVNENFVPKKRKSCKIEVEDNELKINDECFVIRKFDLLQAFYNLDKDNKEYAEDIRLTTTVAWSKLYRRSAFENLLFPEEVRLHEDQMTAHRRIQEAKGLVFVDVPLYYYRQADNSSLIRVGWTSKRLAILDCYEDRLKSAKEVDAEVNNAESHKLAQYICLRTLVCFFRNYCMVTKNQKKIDKEKAIDYKTDIIARMKNIIKAEKGGLTIDKLLFFKAFTVCPQLFVMLFILRNK